MNWAHRIGNVLFERKAAIVQPTLIKEINSAVGPHTPGHSGNSVDYQAKVFFTAAQRLFGPLALSNFLSQFFIRRGKLSGSLDDALFEFFIKTLYFLLSLYQLRGFEDVPFPIAPRYRELVIARDIQQELSSTIPKRVGA